MFCFFCEGKDIPDIYKFVGIFMYVLIIGYASPFLIGFLCAMFNAVNMLLVDVDMPLVAALIHGGSILYMEEGGSGSGFGSGSGRLGRSFPPVANPTSSLVGSRWYIMQSCGMSSTTGHSWFKIPLDPATASVRCDYHLVVISQFTALRPQLNNTLAGHTLDSGGNSLNSCHTCHTVSCDVCNAAVRRYYQNMRD